VDDEADALTLYEAVYGRPKSLLYHRWKFYGMPTALDVVPLWYADANDRLVGQLGGTCIRFKLGRDVHPALQLGEAFTHPDFRRQGVLTALNEASSAHWREAGFSFGYGIPNDKWGTRSQAFGYQKLLPLTWYFCRMRPAARLRGRIPLGEAGLSLLDWPARRRWRQFMHAGHGVDVEPVTSAGPEFDAIWERVGGQYEALLVRDRAWVQYRIFDAPGFGYTVLTARAGNEARGYIAYRMRPGAHPATADLVDCFTAPDDIGARAALLGAMLEDVYARGAAVVRAQLVPGGALAQSCLLAGFRPPHLGLDLTMVPQVMREAPPVLRDPARFFITGADQDLV